MANTTNPVNSLALVVYKPNIEPANGYERRIQDVFERSLKTQMADCRLRAMYVWSYIDPSKGNHEEFFRTSSGALLQKTEQGPRAATVRSLILSGAYPSPQISPSLPKPYPGTMDELLASTVRETVDTTISKISYNGLQPFNKTAKQISEGRSFKDTRIDFQNEEETGSTCIGMSHALLKQLKEKHGIDGIFAAQRVQGQEPFCHAAVVVECSDGCVLLDPQPNPQDRIFSIPFDKPVTFGNKTFSAAHSGSAIVIFETNSMGDFEYRTHLANGDDLIAKYFMMDAPPAFPIIAYHANGVVSKLIWISPLHAKLTFKNMVLDKSDPARTDEVSFQDVQENGFHDRLERFYSSSSPTFNITLESLYQQILKFESNAKIIDQLFHEIFH